MAKKRDSEKTIVKEKLDELVDSAPEIVKDETKQKTPLAKKVVTKIKQECELFQNQTKTPYIAPNRDGTLVLEIGSDDFRRWLTKFTMDNFNDAVLKRNQIEEVETSLAGLALYRGTGIKPLNVRIARDVKNRIIWYDFGKTAAKITDKGWIIVAYPPIFFKRYKNQICQIFPSIPGDINLLRKYTTIKDDDDWLLLIVFIISCFIADFPKPLLALTGDQGSGKSFVLRLIKNLVDPSVIKGSPTPRTTEELIRLASQQAILLFDNLSGMKQDLSDDFCRLATGDTFSKRKLFTDDGEILFDVCRPIMVNGINSVITQADLLDRTIPISISRIPDEERKPEYELLEQFEKDKPTILAGIFDILVKVLKKFPDIKLEKLPRMADFAKWGYAIADSIDGYTGADFIEAYSKIQDKQSEEAFEASPLAQGIVHYMENKEEIELTPTDLLHSMTYTLAGFKWDNKLYVEDDPVYKYLNRSPIWPKTASALTRSLNRNRQTLQSKGIIFETGYKDKNERKIKLINLPRKTEKEELIKSGKWIDHETVDEVSETF